MFTDSRGLACFSFLSCCSTFVRRVPLTPRSLLFQIVVKIVILLSAHDSAKSKHAQALHAPAPDAQQNVWHAATPNHMRPGFSHPTSRPWHPEAGDVTFH